VGLVYSVCTVVRMLAEAAERAMITKRFQTYVDPTLVDYVLEHSELEFLKGERRELTVVFTDLAGFTTLSERLGEQIVPLLNDFLGVMVPIIRRHGGYVNKFLGDGIMFFFGAPRPNKNHAADAVATVLEMQEALVTFNDGLKQRGLPQLAMRVGLCTGEMVVGNAGSRDASDYTVLGDNVNLASRLEGANKATGSWILMSDRTAQLLDGQFIVRPIGKLVVVGKTEGVMTFEALSHKRTASAEQVNIADATRAFVDAYATGDFAKCLQALDEFDAKFGVGKLTKLYRQLARNHVLNGPGEGFNGSVTLTEK
jgi:adenylate cyclase